MISCKHGEKTYLYVIFYRPIWLFPEIVYYGFAQAIVLSVHLFQKKPFVEKAITHTTDVTLNVLAVNYSAFYLACSLSNDTHCIRPLTSND
jgi:hypothetical protein